MPALRWMKQDCNTPPNLGTKKALRESGGANVPVTGQMPIMSFKPIKDLLQK